MNYINVSTVQELTQMFTKTTFIFQQFTIMQHYRTGMTKRYLNPCIWEFILNIKRMWAFSVGVHLKFHHNYVYFIYLLSCHIFVLPIDKCSLRANDAAPSGALVLCWFQLKPAWN